MSTRKPRWPKVPAGFVRAMLSGHSELGLLTGALIYLVCLTGTFAVFVNELQIWEQPSAPLVGAVEPAAVDRALHAGFAAADSGMTDLYASIPTIPGQHLGITAYRIGHEQSWFADADGALAVREAAPWTEFVGDLHMTLTMPSPWGITIVGVSGVALFGLLISGVLAHPRIFRDAFDLRIGGARRLREADLHNRLSVWALPFHAAVTLTGAFFGLSTLLVFIVAAVAYGGDIERVTRPLYGPEASADKSAAPLPDFADMLRRALAQQPGNPTFVGVDNPGTAGQTIMIEIEIPGRLVRGERFYFDGQGRQVSVGGFASGSLGLQAYSAAASLHFGTFGGMLVKAIYGILGLALSVVSAGGITIWLVRRRDQGRPLPLLEKIWPGCVWGVPVALGVALFASRLVAPAPVFWVVLAAIAGLSTLFRDGIAASRWLRLGTVLVLVVTAAYELALSGAAGLTGYAAGVNLTLLFSAFSVAVPLVLEWRRAPREVPA